MKKFLKSCAKKSLSLFMTVMMLMSCWVWIAPTEAEAANAANGEYQVRLVAKSNDDGEVTALSAKVYYDGGSKDMTAAALKDAGTSDTYSLVAATCDSLPGFPTKFDLSVTIDKCNGHKTGTYFFQLEVYNNTSGQWVKVNNDPNSGIGWSGFDGTKSIGSDDGRTHTMDTAKPTASVIGSGSLENKSITIPKIGVTDPASVTCTVPAIKDQYGVTLKNATPSSYYVAEDQGGTTVYSKDSHGIWADNNAVKVNADAQKNTTAQKIYLIAGKDDAKAAIAEISLTYPTYDVTFDQNGSIADLGASMDMSDDTTRTEPFTDSAKYGANISKWAKGTASKVGYDFKGFWTEKQPKTGDASYNAETALFATPVSTADFVNVYGGTEDGTIVEKDGKKYYNAGTPWNPETGKAVSGDITYYGWWISQDISVKFYDIDGKYLGSKTTKYGKTESKNWYPEPQPSYNAGAFEYTDFAEKWRDITGIEIVEGSYQFGPIKSLSLTPLYVTTKYKNEYTVDFVKPADGEKISNKFEYRTSATVPTVAIPGALSNDMGYTYSLLGWTTEVPESGYYHKVAQGNTSVSIVTDFLVRKDVTYYAVYESKVKEYNVIFKYTDSTGADKTIEMAVPYGSGISTPDEVNKTYAKGGKGFTLEGWKYKNNAGIFETLGVDKVIELNNGKIFLTNGNLAPNGTPIEFEAEYDDGVPTPYTVRFKFKSENGAEETKTANVYHGDSILQSTVDELIVPAEYDDGDKLYTFSGFWKVTEGTAEKETYEKDEFTSFSPTSHVTFEAVYDDGVPFYTVTYIDGGKSYSDRILAGLNVPAWLVKEGETEKEYTPVKAETELGEYTFAGWFDAEQTDENFAQTNGIKYTTTDIVTGNLVLYPQFIFEPFKFTIKFVNYDDSVLAEGKYVTGASFESIYDAAVAKVENNGKLADDTYSYSFMGWDHNPGNFLCAGKDMTFKAQYKASYIYYDIKWYANEAAMNAADPEFETVGYDGLLAITSHTFGGKVYAPSVDFGSYLEEGKVFGGWCYKNAEGEETAYQRGMTVVPGMKFYAWYKDAEVTYTITAIVNGETKNYKVNADENATVVGNPADGYVDADKHNKFDGWFDENGDKFDLNNVVDRDITITAKFTESEHDKKFSEIVSEPTYYAEGEKKIWCDCSKKDTTQTVAISKLTDTVAPTGTIYLGTLGKWSSTDEVGAAATDNDEVTLFVNADTDIILAINDTGDVNDAFNADGKGKGIATIQGIISTGVFGAGTTEIAGIQTIFTDNTEAQNNVANYVIRLGDYEGLVDGTTYIAYYYAKDKAGNVLNKNVRTAKFIYDNTAPVITVVGDNNASVEGVKTPTYCGKATVTNVEVGATVTVNGEAVALTTTSAAGVGTYDITQAGNYVITITDKAGNTASKKIIVAEGHKEVTTSKDVTCLDDGYVKVTCAVCGKTIKEETIAHEGHKYGDPVVIAPTCAAGGYTVKTCSVCGDELKSDHTEQLEHVYNKDADGNYIYEVVTPATCSTVGLEVLKCTLCYEVADDKEISLDTENGHNYSGEKILKPTCTEPGKKYTTCKLCFATKEIDAIEATGHSEEYNTIITLSPTCTAEGEMTYKCKTCGTVVKTEPIAKIAHTLKLVEYKTETDKTAEYPNGYRQYECQAVGCTYTEGKEAIAAPKAQYTVTFKGAGVDGADLVFNKYEGETIAIGDVADPQKDADDTNTYTFAGWKSSAGNIIKLPVNVTKEDTYTAEFTAKAKIYTNKFMVSNVWDAENNSISTAEDDYKEFAKVTGKYNDDGEAPVEAPKFTAINNAAYLKKCYKFEFKGWSTDKVNVAEIKEMTEDATYYAVFEKTPVKYTVTYLNGTTPVKQYEVNGGATIPTCDVASLETKAPTAQGHYSFDGWSMPSADTKVTSNITIQAKFKFDSHSFGTDGQITTQATCKDTGVKTFTCGVCGTTKTEPTPIVDHNYVDGKCSMCGKAQSQNTFTITFKNYDGSVVLDKSAEPGSTVVCGITPKKPSTAEFDYNFIGWYADGDTSMAVVENIVANSNATYIAKFEEITRTYTVTYKDGSTVLKTFKLEYGANVPTIEYAPELKSTGTQHLEFKDKWEVDMADAISKDEVGKLTVSGDMVIVANYDLVDHSFTSTEIVYDGIKCKVNGKKYDVCACGEKSVKFVELDPAEHTYTDYEFEDSTFDTEGYKKYHCTVCNSDITETIACKPNYVINIKVFADNGEPAAYASVTLRYNGKDYKTLDTKEDGTVSFRVAADLDKSLWTAYIVSPADIAGGISGAIKKTAKEEGKNFNVFNESKAEEPDIPDEPENNEPKCSCSCHKNTFWGAIFRFFYKIIRFFTGKDCCADPVK